MRQRVTYKLATVCYKAKSTSTPAYLRVLLVPHVPSPRSSHAPRLAVPRTRTVFASRAFSVAAATVWNSLPENVVKSDTLPTFRERLKSHLFTASCETFLPQRASAFLIMALNKFCHCIVLYCKDKNFCGHDLPAYFTMSRSTLFHLEITTYCDMAFSGHQ